MAPSRMMASLLWQLDPKLQLVWHATALVSIAMSSAFYTWIWYRPLDWMRVTKGLDPCSRMALYAHCLKVLQFVSIGMCTNWDVVKQYATNPLYLIPALAFGIFGQHLNARVYELLGQDGVYYGYRFGKQIPWRYEWPYSHVRDPQYLGASCTLIGGLLLGFPSDLCLHWLANYAYLVWLESRVPE